MKQPVKKSTKGSAPPPAKLKPRAAPSPKQVADDKVRAARADRLKDVEL